MIDWNKVQARLGVGVDGDDGPKTYLALIDRVGQPCQPVADCLARYAHDYGMTTPARLAEFLAQIANETGGFIRWEEDLRYSVEAMLRQWPKHFDAASAQECFGHPDRIAERAYGGRMGNGPVGCGDGARYIGRGALQLTGRATYAQFGHILGIDLVGHPEKAAEPYTSALLALEFFKERNVNAAVDRGDFTEARRLTNGGAIGLEHVAALRGQLLQVLA